MLETKNISVSYGDFNILNDISFSLEDGSWLMIVGPNGAGKSTLVGAISQNAPYTGSVLFDGADLKSIKPRDRAKKIGVLTQNHYVGYSFSVREVVGMGRYAHRGGLFSKGKDDESSVDRAIRMTGMEAFAHKSVLTLSGGELQRTFLAQLFAQDPELLLLDEPTNHLDLIYQKQVFMLIGEWIRRTGRSVVSVVHDLSLAKKYGTHILLLDRGKTAAYGKTEEVLTKEILEKVYSFDIFEWMNEMLEQWRI